MEILEYLQDAGKVLISLLAVINPISQVPIYIDFTNSLDEKHKNKFSLNATLTLFIVCLVALLTGFHLLELFNISIYSFRIAGGIFLFITGIKMMADSPKPKEISVTQNSDDVMIKAIVPLGLPLLGGAGTMSTVVLFSENISNLLTTSKVFTAIFISSIIVYIVLRLSDFISRKLGKLGMTIMTKTMGLIMIAISVEFITKGLMGIFTNWIK